MTTATRRRAHQGERRKDIEEWLNEHGVDWEYVSRFPLDEIDRDASFANQARVGEPVDEELVEQYQDAIANEARFPALVVARGGAKAKAVNIDGNHRFEAALREELDDFGVYVVWSRPNTNVVRTMTFEANTRHGRPTSVEERVQQAVWLVNNNRFSLEQAAGAVNVPVSAVRSKVDKLRADARAEDVRLRLSSEWDPMPQGVKTRLNSISTDEGFKAAARLAFQAQLTTAETDDLVRAVNAVGRSAAKQEAAVRQIRGQYRQRVADTAAGKARRGGFTPHRRFTLAVSNVLALPENFVDALADEIEPEQRHATAEQARVAAQRLAELAAALEP